MILRSPHLTDRHFTLPLPMTQTPVKMFDPGSDRPPIGKAEPSAESSTMASLLPSIAKRTEDRIVESDESGLTFESVVAWLAVQDENVRSSCASVLATEVTKIYENAKRDGFAGGRGAAEEAAMRASKQAVALLQKVVVAAQTAFEKEEKQLENICVAVVGEAIAKIAGPLLASEQAALGAIRIVLARVREGRELTIRVSREDFSVVSRLQDELTAALAGRKCEFVADNRLELGGCIIESKLGSLDGRFESQLRELYETLRLAKASVPEMA